MSVSILVVDDEPDLAEPFRQRFRRETREGKYVLHYATSGAEALDRLAGEIEPTLVAVLIDRERLLLIEQLDHDALPSVPPAMIATGAAHMIVSSAAFL
jgi:CheY-like chemotaxis protein